MVNVLLFDIHSRLPNSASTHDLHASLANGVKFKAAFFYVCPDLRGDLYATGGDGAVIIVY